MAIGNKTNVIVGAARVFVASAGTAIPAPIKATRYSDTLDATVGWTDVGYTQNGVAVSYQPTFADVKVDQLLDAARITKTDMMVTISTTFAESTLSNLLLVWAQASTSLTLYSGAGDSTTGTSAVIVIAGGHLGDAPLERELIVVGNGPEVVGSGYSERIYTATRAISVDTSEHSLLRTDPTVFPVSFRLLPDDTLTGAPYGTIRDRLPQTTWS